MKQKLFNQSNDEIEVEKSSVEDQKTICRIQCSIQIFSMIMVTLHSTLMPFLVKIANKTHFLSTTSVFMMEVLKLFFCLSVVFYKNRNFKGTFEILYEHLWGERIETLKVSLPAVSYAIQNNLYYIALENIDATTYSVSLQLRILTTAALSVCMLNKILSKKQWAAQLMAMIGVIMVQLDKKNSEKSFSKNFAFGLAAVFGMCWTSAFAGVYFEKMLKTSKVDVWIQNIRLSLLTLFFATITMLANDFDQIIQCNFFQGWSRIVWIVTILNSIGGIFISFVMKYADNVMKTYCQSFAIGLTSSISIIIGERQFSFCLAYGVILVTVSILVYSYFPASQQSEISSSKIEYQKLKYDKNEEDRIELLEDIEENI